MINIVLFEPEIPQNTGNIMRTCVATNSILHLIKPYGFVLNDNTIKRSGVNYIDKLKYYEYNDWEDFKSKNKGTYFFFTRYGHVPHSDFDYKSIDDIYLIFGKESTGIPKEILKEDLSHCIRLPMSENVRALNVSNCVAICTYEVLRQKNYEGLLFDDVFKGKDYLEK